ncbi:response regulator [Paenibacillus sp. FSL R7-0216]|uniref:response regulator transcription factor n=1 Tax=Paenibacillus sp. FSL R7-0216 TaxID=2921677 RepID=UPI0030DD78B9
MDLHKVVVIDDEVLAIEHLRHLIDWPSVGFVIAGETTRPTRALALIQEVKPDLIISDIKMPMLDGIELCKQVVAAGLHCRILLLTSYKEFDYVKEALKFGASGYLVKHELEPEILLRELEAIKPQIEEERERLKTQLRQLLIGLIDGNSLGEMSLGPLLESLRLVGSSLTYVMIAAGNVVPLKELGQASVFLPGLPPIDAHLLSEKVIEVFNLYSKEGQVGMVLAFQPSNSRLKLAEAQFEAVSELRRLYQEANPAEPIYAAYSSPFSEWRSLAEVHAATMERLKQRWFSGSQPVISPESRGGSGNEAARTNYEWRERLERARKNEDPEQLLQLITETFDIANQTKDAFMLEQLCDELAGLLKNERRAKKMEALTSRAENDEFDMLEWRGADGVKEGFLRLYRNTFLENSASRYTGKVREAIEFISQAYNTEISTDSIANRLGISGDHLRHLFKEETGQTLLEYITVYRMEKAKRLLRTGRYKLYEVADRVGYRSSHYFSKIFHKTTGLLPLEYAKRKEREGDE